MNPRCGVKGALLAAWAVLLAVGCAGGHVSRVPMRWSEELAGQGVTVTALCPAGMPTTLECLAAIEAQGKALLAMGPQAVLMKGGHGDGPEAVDLLITTPESLYLMLTSEVRHHHHGPLQDPH